MHHIAEELWSILGHKVRLHWFLFQFEAKHLVESEKEYPFPSTGKMRFTITLPLEQRTN
jgi:leucyl-tRNA synthetase